MLNIKSDTEFTRFARNLQNKWRLKNKFPIGGYIKKNQNFIELGNYIQKDFAFNTGANFLTENIFEVVKNSLINKERGAKIEETRLFTNMLSSQPLAFNLFGEMVLDKKLANVFFSSIFPKRIESVENIIFEHSDGRGDSEYTGDHSAFDVFVEYIPKNKKKGFIGIEVKYAESLKNLPSSHKERYEELTRNSELFKEDSISFLKESPIQQIWRDHLLSISHLHHYNKKYDEGFFVYLFPNKNKDCENAVSKYIKQFKSFNDVSGKHDEFITGFYPRCLEDFMKKLIEINPAEWTNDLILRYFGNF